MLSKFIYRKALFNTSTSAINHRFSCKIRNYVASKNIDCFVRGKYCQIGIWSLFQRSFSTSTTHSKCQPVMLVPTRMEVGLTTVSAGFVQSLQNQGIKAKLHNLIAYNENCSTYELDENQILENLEKPLDIKFLDQMLSEGDTDKLLDFFVASTARSAADSDLVVVPGVKHSQNRPYVQRFNSQVARALDAKVVLVATPGGDNQEDLSKAVKIVGKDYANVSGCIFNKVGSLENIFEIFWHKSKDDELLSNCTFDFPVIGNIGWNPSWLAPTVKDIVEYLEAEPLFSSKIEEKQVLHLVLAASMSEVVQYAMKPGKMIITSGDRADVIASTCAASNNGLPIAGLLLTGGHRPREVQAIREAVEKGLPVISVKTDNLKTLLKLQTFKTRGSQIEQVKDVVAEALDKELMNNLKTPSPSYGNLSPPAFRYQVMEKARNAGKTIVLPEGDDPRIQEAANECARTKIAKCILLGDPTQIEETAAKNGVSLDPGVEIIDHTKLLDKYLSPLMKLRQHKGLTEEEAKESLKDPIFLGTMMLAEGHVDGLVAGANTSTANTISPALKLIKTAPSTQLVSSVFFMCLPHQVLVYGDCAVNPNPSVEDLADIAIQSADTAAKFGVSPRVAMISYSTGQSGTGPDVVKVGQATSLVRERRPELIVDGPIQYDAAFSPEVAKKKAPNSPLEGLATVYVFPDLNTANTAYKAVQRSAGVLSIGPMLQGLNKPVNDLSRGASLQDIVYTVALTAIQAE